MWNLLRTRRWAIATVTVVAICALFVALGQWQLRRHGERQIENTVNASRIAAEPLALATLIDAAGSDIDSLEYRPVRVVGTFVAQEELLVRSQVADERPGFHVVTPLVTDAGTVLINRGWVPLAAERPPVDEVSPPTGTVTVTGLARLSQQRPAIGPTEPEGRLGVVARIDLDRLGEQFDDLVPLWVQQTDPSDDPLPVRVPIPDVDDPGPHLPYAVQWFSFALIGAGGFGFLVRRAIRTGS